MTQFHEEAVKIQLQHAHGKGLIHLPGSLCCQLSVLGTSAMTKVQGETEPETSTRGKAQVADCPGPREPGGGSARGALLAAASNLGNLLGNSGNPEVQASKRKALSLAFAIGNHEQGNVGRATW